MGSDNEPKLLTELIQDADLEKLEAMLGEFNIFTALSLERMEIKHSRFLAWLLNPSASHGLGDYFLKLFLRLYTRSLGNLGNKFPSVFDIDSWDLDDVEVRREWHSIDILLLDHTHKFLVVIENKVYSGQHGHQLQRYMDMVKAEFPNFRTGFAYLFVRDDEPELDDYVPLTYSQIIPLINQVIVSKRSSMSSDIATFITHYMNMVERYIVRESEIQNICQQIYRRHRQALDLISKTVASSNPRVLDLATRVLQSDPDYLLDDPGNNLIRFIPTRLDWIPKKARGWTSSNRILLFWISQTSEELQFTAYLGPGDADLRKQVYDAAQRSKTFFNKAHRKLTPVWFCLHKTSVVPLEEVEEIEDDNAAESLLKAKLDGMKATLFEGIIDNLEILKAQTT